MEVMLYTKTRLKKFYVGLIVEGENWDEIDSKAKNFCEENEFELAGGYYNKDWPTNYDHIYIYIDDKNWQEKYDEFVSRLVAREV